MKARVAFEISNNNIFRSLFPIAAMSHDNLEWHNSFPQNELTTQQPHAFPATTYRSPHLILAITFPTNIFRQHRTYALGWVAGWRSSENQVGLVDMGAFRKTRLQWNAEQCRVQPYLVAGDVGQGLFPCHRPQHQVEKQRRPQQSRR